MGETPMPHEEASLSELFDVSGKVVVITGGGGVLCSTLGEALARRGAAVALLDLRPEAAQQAADRIAASGGRAVAVGCDVTDRASVQSAHQQATSALGPADALINGAGGNHPQATTSAELEFFDIPAEALQFVFNLNFLGTLIPSQVIGREMAARGEGVIVNISSMNALRPITRIPAYSAAKAAVSNFTQWLAVHMSQNYSKRIRVNAIAPGFFLTEQNRFVLIDRETGELTPRAQTVIQHTPMARLGDPQDLVGTVLFLLSPASEFVHGVVLPIDGGFSAFGGV